MRRDGIKLFGFVEDIVPFFDDYRSNEVCRSDTPTAPGPVWIYKNASGAPWSFLRKYPARVGVRDAEPSARTGAN